MAMLQYQGLGLPLPEGWTDGTVLVAQGPEQAGFRASIVAARHPLRPNETLQQFAVRTAGAKANLKAARFAAVQGLLREDTIAPGGKAMYHAQFYVVRGRTGIVVMITDLASRQADAAKLFAAVLERLQLPAGAAGGASDRGLF
jgi:hypothetical protein